MNLSALLPQGGRRNPVHPKAGPRRHTPARRYRPSLEGLEDRSLFAIGVLDTTLSSVVDPAGQTTLFAVNAARHLYEHSPAGTTFLAGGVRSISAGTDAAGQPQVLVLFDSGNLWKHSATASWSAVAAGVREVAAGVGNTTWVIFTNGSLWRSDSRGWAPLAEEAEGISAGTDGLGRPQVYAEIPGRAVYKHNAVTGWTFIAWSPDVDQLVAGANDTAFVTFSGSNHLYRHDQTGWQFLASGVQSLSVGTAATGGTQVYAQFDSGLVYRHDVAAGWQFVASDVTRMTGAGAGGFAIVSFGGLYRFHPSTGWAAVGGGF